jgi:hypothetical protein
MTWVSPVTRSFPRQVGQQVARLMAARSDDDVWREQAFEDAEARAAGSVLEVVTSEGRVWVVFSRDEPLTAYPPQAVSLYTLLAGADLGVRRTPEQWQTSREARRAARRAGARSAAFRRSVSRP